MLPSKKYKAQRQIILLTILLLSYTAKISIWSITTKLNPSLFYSNDSIGYQNIALAFMQTGKFAVSPEQPDILQSFRTPGFPLLIALSYYILGINQSAFILILILLSLLTLCLTYKISQLLFGYTTGIIATLLLSLDVLSFTYSLKYLTETFFTLLITVTLLTMIRFLQNSDTKKWIFISGLSLTLATFVRPIAYYLIFSYAIGVSLWAIYNRWNWTKISSKLLLLLIPFILLIGGWQIRNYTYLGSSQFSSVSTINLLSYRAASIIALRDKITIQEARQSLNEQVKHHNKYTLNTNLTTYKSKFAISIIEKHPILFLKT